MKMGDLADIGVIGLAVMGKNLILNINDHGFRVCAYNRTVEKVDEFLREEANDTKIIGSSSIDEFISRLKTPRIILLMVKSGNPVDDFLNMLIVHLKSGDVVIDGGNSNYLDTERRVTQLKAKGIHFVGCGISGGEEGARFGPSIMPGGTKEAWPLIQPIFQSIAAKASADSMPCCEWIGNGGAGHFVKMVHNGIEYADMQIICEAYDILRKKHQLSSKEIAEIFSQWNSGKLESFLIQICSQILSFTYVDLDGNEFAPIDRILDVAGQKGTGKLTVQSSLEHGVNTSVIAEAVYCRMISASKKERKLTAKIFSQKVDSLLPSQSSSSSASGEAGNSSKKHKEFDSAILANDIIQLRDAVYASKIIAYAQGFMLMDAASRENQWDLNFQSIASIWRNGCIIRSAFLSSITEAYQKCSSLSNLLVDNFFQQEILSSLQGWRYTVCNAVMSGIPIPTISASLSYFDSIRSDNLPMNLLQAMRDYFGAHTFEYEDHPGVPVHIQWTETSGKTASTTYNA